MKLDRKTVDGFLRLPDDKLWQLLRLLAGPYTSLGEPNAEMLRKLRAVLAALTEADLERIDALRAVYKDAK